MRKISKNLSVSAFVHVESDTFMQKKKYIKRIIEKSNKKIAKKMLKISVKKLAKKSLNLIN